MVAEVRGAVTYLGRFVSCCDLACQPGPRGNAGLGREQIVALTAFGALMVATNVFNNALDVELDGYLEP